MPTLRELTDRLESADFADLLETLKLLEECGRSGQVDDAERERIERRLLELVHSHEISESLREEAARCLGTLGKADPLLSLFQSDDATLRGHAAAGLGEIGSEASVAALIRGLTDGVNKVRNLSERALMQDLDAVRQWGIEPLLALLGHAEPLTQSPAARLLGLTQDARALAPLSEMLRSAGPWLCRMWAARGLGDLQQAEAFDTLAAAARGDEKNRVRATAAEALGQLRHEQSAAVLNELLLDDDEGVRTAAQEALEALGKSADAETSDPFAE